jgi:hypothetical protein
MGFVSPKPLTQLGTAQTRLVTMTSETTILFGLGIAAVIAVWLVFSIFRKIIGFVFLAAVAAGIYYVWRNPSVVEGLAQAVELWMA